MKIPLMRWNDFRHERIIFPQWADTIIGQWNKHQFDSDIKSLGAQNIMALAETNYSIYTDHKAFKKLEEMYEVLGTRSSVHIISVSNSILTIGKMKNSWRNQFLNYLLYHAQ